MRLAVLTSHPIQYYAPLFRRLAQHLDLHVFFSHDATPGQQAAAGFGTAFNWDIDLRSGYSHSFLANVARSPHVERFGGCDTPEIGARLREGRFSGVLTLGWHLKSLLQGVWAAKRLGLPVLVRGDSQLTTPRSPVKKWAKEVTYPTFLRVFDAALYVGARNRAYYDHYGFDADKQFRSPHCVDTERFAQAATHQARQELRSRLAIGLEQKLVLFAGKLVPFKQPFDFVDAIARLRQNGLDAHAMVAGSGELETAVRQRAKQHAVPLHLLGFQNQSEMPAAYAAADALVLPSNGQETWGLVCNEALACGTPIVVSDAAGCAPDLASDGHVGRAFPLGEVDACAAHLTDLFAAPPSAADISAISTKFSVEAAANGVVEALAYTLGRSRALARRSAIAKPE